MGEKNESSSSSFPIGRTAQERELSYVPECYKVQSSQQPQIETKIANDVPIIDLAAFTHPTQRPILVEDVANACRRHGLFQVINHGISQEILDEALSVAHGFFTLPTKEKAKFMSNDVHKPVRYGSSIKDGEDKVQFWRLFLKHYAHPLNDWISMWPDTPPNYREKMGKYVVAVQKVGQKIIGIITESLGLGPTYLGSKVDEGMQVMAVNCYPHCPEAQLTLGLPPHSDYACLTILLQDSPGLQILDSETNSWRVVPVIQGALEVHVGDQLEVLTNGRYKSVVHRVTLNAKKARVSIAGLHTLGMDIKVEAIEEMVDEEHPNGYKESSFTDFLNFISKNDIGQGNYFINTLKKTFNE